MPLGPQESLKKISAVTAAWQTLRPAKSFGGMTLDQFKSKIQPSLDARAAVTTIENQLIAAQDQRDAADALSLAAVQLVVAGVRGDPSEGENSELYEAMGYVRKSERASGLHRQGQPNPPTPGGGKN
ncbi:MAG TPA: hypothetical protein VMI53_02205 [Opitutaceae bacterium]|nr:hypothetical protein [Opitutaceae bacterium]